MHCFILVGCCSVPGGWTCSERLSFARTIEKSWSTLRTFRFLLISSRSDPWMRQHLNGLEEPREGQTHGGLEKQRWKVSQDSHCCWFRRFPLWHPLAVKHITLRNWEILYIHIYICLQIIRPQWDNVHLQLESTIDLYWMLPMARIGLITVGYLLH